MARYNDYTVVYFPHGCDIPRIWLQKVTGLDLAVTIAQEAILDSAVCEVWVLVAQGTLVMHVESKVGQCATSAGQVGTRSA